MIPQLGHIYTSTGVIYIPVPALIQVSKSSFNGILRPGPPHALPQQAEQLPPPGCPGHAGRHGGHRGGVAPRPPWRPTGRPACRPPCAARRPSVQTRRLQCECSAPSARLGAPGRPPGRLSLCEPPAAPSARGVRGARYAPPPSCPPHWGCGRRHRERGDAGQGVRLEQVPPSCGSDVSDRFSLPG